MKYKLEDIIGIRSGRLTIIGPFEYETNDNGRKLKKVWCQCDCGEKVLLPASNVVHGGLISCGCIRRNGDYTKRHIIKYEDIAGEKSGMLTVIGSDITEEYQGHNKPRSRMILCQCDCGNIVKIRAADFGRTLSCGCVKTIYKPNIFEGKRFGHVVAIKYVSSKEIHCKCDCGNNCIKDAASLLRPKNSIMSCGCIPTTRKYFFEDFKGEKFGKLTVIGPEKSEDGTLKVLCKCDCGNEIYRTYHELARGRSTSCGCKRKDGPTEQHYAKYKIEDYVGKKFGSLTLTDEYTKSSSDNRKLYKCNCDCGGYKYATLHQLISGQVTSCGCGIFRNTTNNSGRFTSKYNINDYIGKKFGALTVTGKEIKDSRRRWECICDCGKTINADVISLMHGKKTSCGCRINRRTPRE